MCLGARLPMEADGYWLDEYEKLDPIMRQLAELEGERRAREVERGVLAELAAAFLEDRAARPVTVWFGSWPPPLLRGEAWRDGVTVELPPDDQARWYL